MQDDKEESKTKSISLFLVKQIVCLNHKIMYLLLYIENTNKKAIIITKTH